MVLISGAISSNALVCLGISGILSHRLHFIHGEHHLKGPQYLAAWVFATLATICFLYINQYGILQPLILINFAFFGPFFSSIVIYRLFQHPLKGFRGPKLAAVSKLWHLAHVFRTQNYLFLDGLVKKYGKVVRTGPQELTITDPEIWSAIGSSACIKAPWYDMMFPYMSLNSIRGKEGYRTRRKLWDESLRLPTAYLPEVNSSIDRLASLLVKRVDASKGQPTSIRTLFSHFSFDVMGEIAFGRSFALLSDIDSHDAPNLISQGMSMLRFFTPIPWASRLCFTLAPYVPIITQKWNRGLQWAAEVCDERLANGADSTHHSDAFSRFISAAYTNDDKTSLDHLALYGDAFAITVAGSHSTAATLTMLFYELARHPDAQEQARKEILAARSLHAESEGWTQERYPFLDGCINEALRLYPVVPTGGIRQTVAKGIHVGDTWIPPHTVIVAPRWTLGRLESAFDMPNEFIPERWTSKTDMVKDARAFNGFGIGQHMCPGKQLGLAEVRLVASKLLTSFRFTFKSMEPNKTKTVTDMQDAFTLAPGELELVFSPLAKSP
ncbi:cytochrome P450 [Xylaria intraflava]|nr:cytochrome P450 [Xylaria intraflava]